MKYRMSIDVRTFFPFALIFAGICLSVGIGGCGSSKPAQPDLPPTRYSLTGRVVSIDKAKQQVNVDAKDIPGFMSAMQMAYAVKNPALLDPLSPEDQITADVLVKGNDIWLENIVVVKKPDDAKNAVPSDAPLKAAPPPAKQ